ncbi:piezo-type mechanosensitive ion channel component isoform X3 [Anopheles darlingi]|uniref:piezo-type mechanosensitive ion channel component isoform X3 n=1 Tax=Anopheles darlingi TaxID=43151 RepID=UPI0021001C93|nr:piezo-type mechanosensitive ion channel component isoform X3 [Anopheles darlingi]
MAKFFLCLIIQRLVLPLILATCLLMKPVGLSLPYLIFLLMIPYVPVANKKTIVGHAGLLFKLLFVWTLLVLMSLLVYQVILISSSIESCSVGGKVLRHIGIVKFHELGAWMIVYWLAPEVILACTALGMLIVLRKLTGVVGPRRRRGRNGASTADTAEQGANISVQESCATTTEDELQSVVVSPERVPFFTKLGILLSMCILCVTGVLQPSALSGVYFLVFLGAASWWACYKQLDKAFGIVLKVTLVFLVTHITLFLAYQNPGPQELLPYNETAARVLALKPILSSTCDLLNQTDIRDVHFNSSFDTDVYLNPIFLIVCYYCITMTSSLLLRSRFPQHQLLISANGYYTYGRSTAFSRVSIAAEANSDAPDERTPLMRRGTHRIRDASATDGKETAQTDQIALETLEEEEPSSIFEQALLAVRNVASYIYMNSYIFTNVIMMVWSIMYHSWLTFVLLIWANLIWIMPNHRKNMLKSSPVLVIYAELLLLAQYLYGMNLTEEELPTVIDGSSFNLEELGFVRRLEYPCVPLLVKSLFTTMFWISLRQQIQEKHTERRESMIANMASPIQLPIGAATTAATGPAGTSGDRAQEKKSSAFVTQMAKFFKSFMIKFWIWMVALTLFLSAIIGNRMTMFRIVYMVLFLAFVLTFQFSFKIWRKMMYSFWFTVIGYSMAILVLVYVHQFEQFPRYWAMIGISKELQEDIGLEIFKTGQLFLHLLNPTLVVIITVIQLHYCHERFLVISEIPSISEEESEASRTEGNTSAYGTFAGNQENLASDAGSAETIAKEDEEAKTSPTAATIKEEDKDDDGYEKLEDFQFRKLSRHEITSYARKGWKMVLELIELTWLFFEIHMPKIILIVAFSLSVNSVNLLHLLYVVLSVITVKRHTTGKHSVMHGQLIKITRIMSLFSSLMLILTMIYQVKYIKEENFHSECPNIDANVTQMDMNNAQWFGMRKANGGQTLTDLLRPYLAYILMVTVHTVTILRQTIRRIRLGLSPKTPELMFPDIVRADADKDIPRMIMYLFNYGFFKFGVEITLVALIITIGQRMDILSIGYAVWLAVTFHMTRAALQRIWQALTWFIVISIPLQYLLFIGLPPLACVNYPWMIVQLDHFRIWAMLPENTVVFRSFASKMVADFVLLMFLCRQTVVFRLDLQAPKDYGGGSNASVLEDFKKLDDGVFKNPTPDFITKVRNWLDVLKRTLFLVSFWFTLAIVFLSGSNRVNLFSVGYLIGAFFFLWQGTDFYLHSIDYILKRWNMLICYNVFVITCKTLLQLFGCLFLDQMMNNACWVMQLFGVTCLSSTIAPLPPSATEPVDQLCRAPDPSDAGLFWDGMCFAFLLLQRRLFSSHYFCHIINESKASKYLASRGAELIEELRVKESTLEAERERQILEKIKAKMDRIKATQQKILEAAQDSGTHAIDTVDHRSSLKRKISEHRPTAIRSGDYYMFEDVEQEFELEMIEDPQITHQDSEDLEDKSARARSLNQRLTLSRLAAQLKERRMQEVLALSRGNEDGDSKNETGGQSSSAPSANGTEQPLLQRRLSSPGVYRRRRSVTGEHSAGTAAAGLDDNAIVPERSALSEPIPPPHSLSRPRPRKPTGTDEPDVQQAGPSKDLHAQASITDEEARLLSDDEDEDQRDGAKAAPEEEKKGKFSLSGLALIPAFVVGAIGSLTLRLHRVSRNYRYVMRVLSREKQELKETPGFGVGTRDKDGVWTHYVSRTNSSNSDAGSQSGDSSNSLISRPGSPTASSQPHVHSSNANPDHPDPHGASVPPSPAISSITTQPPSAISGPKQTTFREDLTVQLPDTGRSNSLLPEILISAPSAERGLDEEGIPYRYYSNDTLDSKTDGSSTDAIKRTLDEVSSEEDFTSRKHSLIVELVQAIWYAIMSHTDFICYFVVFLNQVNYASLLSLPLPLMVTLWGTLTFPRPSQTFWTKLIAYTQTVVLIKCICQFEMLWWNQTPIPSNQPFHPARLFGIERKDGYATYDLILLLMLFCHRFILKSLGLWKSDPTEEPSLKEGLYQVDPNDERTKALMAKAEENEKIQETFEVRKTDDLTGLSMVRINETAGPMPPPLDDPNSDSTQLCVSIQPEPVKKFSPQIVKEAFLQYTSALKAFFSQLLDRQSRKTADVYGYMFLCDFVNFFVILFGFSAFGTQEGDGGVLSYFEENRVPVTFLLMLIIQFFLIVVDRALYLRKNIVGKILFQFFLIIGLHVWMFFVLPSTTERSFNATTPPILYYMIKCFYLLFSAYQIRCGYPARILGNFLTKGFTMANFSGFKLFMTIPFLFELRTLMDWIWTDTSMTLFDWLKMEDIFTNVYQLKCMRHLEEDLPAPRGQKKGVMVKYLMGGGMMLGIIFLIWFPLALFAFSNAVGEPNIPYDVSVTLRIGPYEPVYMMSAQDNNIHGLTDNNWGDFTAPYATERTALTFLSNYEPADVAAVKLGANSTSIWNISPPDRERLLNDLKSNVTLTCRFRYTISRQSHSKENPGVVSEERGYEMGPGPDRDALIKLLTEDTNDVVVLPNLMPKFLRVQNSGTVRPIHQLIKNVDSDTDDGNYRNLKIRLLRSSDTNAMMFQWWETREECTDTLYEKYLSRLPYADCANYLVMYMFNDKIFPSTISSIAAGGIIGIYSTMILVFSRMLRTSIFSGASSKIMFEDLPYVDRVLQLCLDIYLVRESCEFTLEEDLFAKLLFLYRSPETMIKWSRPKNEGGGDDETDTMADVPTSHPKQE